MTKVFKSGKKELGEIAGHKHFWYAVSGKKLAEAVGTGIGCCKFEI